jgi:bacillithiol biosynthesis cysteine-adding enzyme BshC
LSAVKLARCLTGRGTEAVPVFWMATEDHDWNEVRSAEFVSCDGHLAHTSVESELHREGVPVGTVMLGESVSEAIQHLLDGLPTTEFTPALESLIRDAYQPGRTYTEAFARMMTALVGSYGLVLLDPLDARLKQLAAPFYAEAARSAPELAAALDARSRALEAEGYHAQVLASSDSFPLFLHDEKGARRAVSRAGVGTYGVKGVEKQQYTAEELAEWAAREPECFSPNVTLRGVVQDYLLPTIAYFGGAAEVAYFAQTAEVYRLLNRPVTPVLHRASLTLIERRTVRTLERYGLNLNDFFDGLDKVIAHVVEQHLGAETARAFDRADAATAQALNELHEQLRQFDSTLGDALGNGRRKIEYQLAGLRARFHRAQMTRDDTVHRQLERANTALYPEKSLQERHVNITSLVARHGLYVVDWIFAAIDPGAAEHQIVFL